MVFNKYYQPEFWKQEPWFDRSHDIVFDWLISVGILGFLAYLSIWGTAIFTAIKKYKKKYFNSVEISLLFALFAAYAFHNIFVFDNLTSYFLFFSVLGYLHVKYVRMRSENEPEKPAEPRETKNIGTGSYLLITLVFIAVVFFFYFANIKPILAGRQLIVTLNEVRSKGADVNFMLGEFDKVFSYKTFGTPEAREQLASYAEQILSASSIAKQDKAKVIAKAIDEMKLQVAEAPQDARGYLFLTSLYVKAAQLEDAMKAALKAEEFSPKKQQIRFVVADIYLASAQYDKAFEVLKDAYELDRSYDEAAKYLAIVSLVAGKKDVAEKEIGIPEKDWPAKFGNEQQFINAYAKIGDYEKVKELWQAAIAKDPNNAQLHVSLAATYLQLGDRVNAIKELEKAAELNPDFKQQAESYISEIKAGRNP